MNWRTCHVADNRSTYVIASRPTSPVAVHPSFSQRSVSVSRCSWSHVRHRAVYPSDGKAVSGSATGHNARGPMREAVRYLARVTPLEDAQAFVLESCPPLAAVDIDRRDAVGLVLAAAVVATENVPPFDNTAVDGYAVRSADVAVVPVELRVVGELAAGDAPSVAVSSGTAIRIMTGAPMPEGADAVVMVEDSERIGDHAVRLTSSVPAGAAVRREG